MEKPGLVHCQRDYKCWKAVVIALSIMDNKQEGCQCLYLLLARMEQNKLSKSLNLCQTFYVVIF